MERCRRKLAEKPGVFIEVWTLFVVSVARQKELRRWMLYQESMNRLGDVSFFLIWQRVLHFLAPEHVSLPLNHRERRELVRQAPDAVAVAKSVGRAIDQFSGLHQVCAVRVVGTRRRGSRELLAWEGAVCMRG